MVLTKEEFKVIGLLGEDLFKNYSILDIARKLHKKSYSGIFNIIKKLNNLGIVIIEKKGHANLCNLNLKNSLTLAYLSLLEETKAASASHLPDKNISELLTSIKTPFFIFIVTGSYASRKQTPKSDLDIVVIIEDQTDKRRINVVLNKGEFMIPPIHPYVFTVSEFFEMLTNKDVNYGKEVAKNKIIIYGSHAYYRILEKAIDYGYKGWAIFGKGKKRI